MTQPVVLLAASGLAREVLSAVGELDAYAAVAVLDDDPRLPGTRFGGVTVTGPIETAVEYGNARFVVCAGSGVGRRGIVQRMDRLGFGPDSYATVIHPTVSVGANCAIGSGSVLLANTTLTVDVTLGRHVVVMPNAVVTHDCQLADFATVCAGVALGGRVRVDSAAYLGMNAAIRQNVTVGAESVLGMGSILLEDLPPHQRWVGVPAARMSGAEAVTR